MSFPDPLWIARDETLPRCPRLKCRRARACCNEPAGAPCLRTHQSRDEAYEEIAAVFDALLMERGIAPRPPGSPEIERTYELELKLKAFKEGLEQREREGQ
jgi:hypothetical protein